MAFTTGRDFLSGILGASNSTDVLKKNNVRQGFKKIDGDYRGLDAFENRYGQQIGDDGYLKSGPVTTVFYDTDGDGIDDRFQSGPGEPKAGSNPDSPMFGGGNPPPGGGSGGNNPNSPANSRQPVSYGVYDSPEAYAAQFGNTDSYNPERSLYADYVPSNIGPSIMSYGETAPDLFETGYDLYNMVPSFTRAATDLARTAYDKFINPVDQAIANALGFTSEEGEHDNSEAAAALSLLRPSSYETLNREAIENSLANLAYKEQINSFAEVDPALRERLNSFGDDLSISDYNTALSEFTPTESFPNQSLTTTDVLAAYQQAQRESQAQEAQAEQDRINAMVSSGQYIGTGYNPETGDYSGLLSNPQYNSEGQMTSNNPVQTGPYSPAALSGVIQNEAFNNMMNNRRDRDSRRDPDGNASGAGGNATGGNARESDPGDSGCFEPNTLIAMQDGSEKKIKDVQLGDITKGGKVTGVLQFEPIDDIHEYKGVIVAGSHFVKEGNEFIMVQDSPESVKIDKIPVVYSLDTTNRRIFINDIEFADYNGDGIAKKFLNNAGMDLSGFDKEVLRQVEHRLI